MTERRHPTDDEIHDDALVQAQDICIEVAGRVAEFWGFTRTMGRVYCALFLSPKPMTQAELVERLGISAANVSMSLKGLLRWGAVHKAYEKGSRKLNYVAEPELRRVIGNILGGREQRELKEAVGNLTDAMDIVKSSRPKGKALTGDEGFVADRIAHLEQAARLSNRLLDLLLGEGRVDVNRELDQFDDNAAP